jgi:hypothetical protein
MNLIPCRRSHCPTTARRYCGTHPLQNPYCGNLDVYTSTSLPVSALSPRIYGRIVRHALSLRDVNSVHVLLREYLSSVRYTSLFSPSCSVFTIVEKAVLSISPFSPFSLSPSGAASSRRVSASRSSGDHRIFFHSVC